MRAGEQQPRQRGIAAVARARPPHNGLMARARERDIRQPQLLAAQFLLVLAPVAVPVRAAEPNIDRPRVGLRGVVEKDRLRTAAIEPYRLPQVGAVDNRELKALAAVDSQDMDGTGVGLEPAAALLVTRIVGSLRQALAQPSGQRRRPQRALSRGGVQQLRQVAGICHPALTVAAREHSARGAPRSVSPARTATRHRAYAAHGPTHAAAGVARPIPDRQRRPPCPAPSR